MFGTITKSPFFRKSVDRVFTRIDKDGSGAIDGEELTIAMCHLHFMLSKKLPGLTDPPTPEKVKATLKEYDINSSGGLSKDEFAHFASKWFSTHALIFLKRLFISSFVTMIALPESAALVQHKIPGAKYTPPKIFKLLFGVVLKFIATKFPGRA